MLNLNSYTAASTALALLLLINTITALPTIPHPKAQSPAGKLDPSTIKIHLDEQTIGSSYPPRYDLFSSHPSEQLKAYMVAEYGPECATNILSRPSGQTKTAPAVVPTTTPTTATYYGKGRNRLQDRSNDKNDSSDINNNNSIGKDETPLVRIFPNGAFSPFTTEESQQFLLLQQAQGQGPPKVVAGDGASPPIGAPESISEGGKDSKEDSVYNRSRRCEKTGPWCKMPQKGSVLIAGPGIRACTYYKEEEKIISYTLC